MNGTNLWKGYQEQGGVLCKLDEKMEITAFSEKVRLLHKSYSSYPQVNISPQNQA